MKKRILYYLSVTRALIRVSTMSRLSYRLNGLLILVNSFLRFGVTVVFLQIVFSRTQMIGSWSKEQIFLFYGIYLFCDSLIDMIIGKNLREIPDAIENGQLDMALLRPINSLYLLCFGEYRILNIGNLIFALAVIINSVARLSLIITPLSLLSFILLLFCGMVIYCSIYMLIVTLAFWTIRMQFYELLESLFNLLRFPLDIFSRSWQIFFTLLIPLVFVITVPTKALLGIFDWLEIASPFVAIILLFSALRFWNFALRKYSSASS